MSFGDAISRIIDERKMRVPQLDSIIKEAHSRSVDGKRLFEDLTSLAKVIQPNFRERLSEHARQLQAEIGAFDQQVSLLRELADRFRQDYLTIIVVGKEGSGKSTVLQRITGLNDSVIPSSDEYGTTGAISEIVNTLESQSLSVTTHTAQSFFTQEIEPYLRDLELGHNCQSLSDFAGLELDWARPADQDFAKRRFDKLLEIRRAIPHFEKHLTGRTIPISSLSELQPWITKGKIAGEKITDGQFFAANKVTIRHPFGYKDFCKLRVIDTRGFGDHSSGLYDKLGSIASADADAIILMRNPHTTKVTLEEADTEIIDKLNGRLGAELGVGTGDMLFYCFNEMEGGANAKQCKKSREDVERDREAGTSSIAGSAIVQCKSRESVITHLIQPVLRHLAGSCAQHDQLRISHVLSHVNAANQILSYSLRRIGQLLDAISAGCNPQLYIQKESESAREGFNAGIAAILRTQSSCRDAIDDESTKLLDDCAKSASTIVIPTRAQEVLDQSGKAGRFSIKGVFEHEAFNMRSQIAGHFGKLIPRLNTRRIADTRISIAKTLSGCGFSALVRVGPEDSEFLSQCEELLQNSGCDHLCASVKWLRSASESCDFFLVELRLALEEYHPDRWTDGWTTAALPEQMNEFNEEDAYDLGDGDAGSKDSNVDYKRRLADESALAEIAVRTLGRMKNGAISDVGKRMRECLFYMAKYCWAVTAEFEDKAVRSDKAKAEWMQFYLNYGEAIWSAKIPKWVNSGTLARNLQKEIGSLSLRIDRPLAH